jgi:hypothetical protein
LVTALLAWPIAFGLVLTLLTVFKQQLASMALAPRALVISAVLVSVMAIVVMPLLTVAVSRGRIHAAPRVTPRARRRPGGCPPAHRGSARAGGP